jgi:hypothetical protein
LKVHHILFIGWFILFAFWIAKQFGEHNRRKEKRK